MSFLISFAISSTTKLSKYVLFAALTNKAIQWVPIDSYSWRFIIYTPSFVSDKLLLE